MVKSQPANAGDIRDTGSIPGSERSPRGGNGNPLQYSCLENPMDRGAWWAMVHRMGHKELDTTEATEHACMQVFLIMASCLYLFITILRIYLVQDYPVLYMIMVMLNQASLVAQMVKNPLAMWKTWALSLGRGKPLEKGMATHSSILAWRITRSLVG